MNKIVLAAALALPMAAFAAGPELVTNGSFEANTVTAGNFTIFTGTQVTGWTAVDEIEIRNADVGNAKDGVNFVELDANHNSSMFQTLTTVAGQAYSLSFYYSNRTGTNVSTDGLSFNVGAGAVMLPGLAVNNTGDNVWSLYTTDFTAASSSTTLTFSAAGTSDSFGSSLDKVSVAAVPEPETYALMLGGLAMLGFISRRRRSA